MAPLPIMVRTTRRERFMLRPCAKSNVGLSRNIQTRASARGKRKPNASPDRAAKVSPVLSRRQKNAPRTPAQTHRTRRASLRPSRIRQKCRKTNGLMWHRHRRNCCATTIRPSRHGPHWKKIPAAGIRRPVGAATARPFPRPSVRNSRAASARRRHPRSQACPSGEVPHVWSV
jgi:hypothetical protein